MTRRFLRIQSRKSAAGGMDKRLATLFAFDWGDQERPVQPVMVFPDLVRETFSQNCIEVQGLEPLPAPALASSGTIGIAGTFQSGPSSYTITGSTMDFNGTGSDDSRI